jgi:hypothetical protein
MNTNNLWVRVVCGFGASVCVLYVCVCTCPLPFLQMSTVHMFNDDTSVFLLFGYLFHHPLFLISDHVQLFQRLPKVVYSLTSYSRCVVVSWPQCWAVFGWPPLSQPPPSLRLSSTLWPPGSVVWGKKSTNQYSSVSQRQTGSLLGFSNVNFTIVDYRTYSNSIHEYGNAVVKMIALLF